MTREQIEALIEEVWNMGEYMHSPKRADFKYAKTGGRLRRIIDELEVACNDDILCIRENGVKIMRPKHLPKNYNTLKRNLARSFGIVTAMRLFSLHNLCPYNCSLSRSVFSDYVHFVLW